MRCFGERRVASIALGLAAMLGMSLAESARADGFFHTPLPKDVPAYDFNTGGEYFAPPVPYGHYAKDPHGAAAKAVGHVAGPVHGLGSHLKGKLAGLHGAGGHGLGHGHGLGGLGHGLGNGHGLGGHGLGNGHGLGGLGHGHGLGGGHGFGLGNGCGLGGCKHGGAGIGSGLAGLCGDGGGHGHGHGHGRVKNFGPYHPTGVVATSQSVPSGQSVVVPNGQGACGLNGCGLGGLHDHFSGLLGKLKCKGCGGSGNGCGFCGGAGFGDPCSSCHGAGIGCGACGGCGLLSKLKQCLHCGGRGCQKCLAALGGLKGKLHGLVGGVAGPKYKWFVGPGGPVPLTPGYVPYIVTTRSPRDFFAFPPRNPDGF